MLVNGLGGGHDGLPSYSRQRELRDPRARRGGHSHTSSQYVGSSGRLVGSSLVAESVAVLSERSIRTPSSPPPLPWIDGLSHEVARLPRRNHATKAITIWWGVQLLNSTPAAPKPKPCRFTTRHVMLKQKKPTAHAGLWLNRWHGGKPQGWHH